MKRYILYIMRIFVCILSIGFFDTTVNAAEFLDGDGSAENPYIIANKSQFNNALKHPEANFLLYADLIFDVGEVNTFESFSGVFDGNNHKIVLPVDETKSPIFGTLSGTVKNLTLSGTFESASFAEILTSGGIISHCRNEGKCSVYGSAGGIVVTCNGTIELSSNAGDIYGNTSVGGIAATCNGMIDRCYNTGNVTRYGTVGKKAYDYLGGICGKGNNIVNCYNTGMIDGIYDNYNSVTRSAGIVGYSTKVVNCYNAGRIVGPMCGSIIAETSVFIETAENSCSNCYYYNEDKLARYAPQAELGDINACYYTQLCQQNTFENFDFESVWIIESEDYLMPQLRNNLHIDRKNDTDNFCGGNGTFYSPFLISERKHLSNMEMYPAAYYRIVSDIDVGSWTTIFDNNIFWGVLDGNEHTLSNIEVKITKKDNKTSDAVAFMGSCYGIIRNLNISNSDFSVVVYTNYNSNYALAGTFAVNLNGKIENCKTLGTGTVSAHCCYDDDLGGSSLSIGWAYAGGIVARGQGKIINCENNFKVLSNNHSGGIISYYCDISSEFPTQKLSVEYCVNKGTIEVVNYNPETSTSCSAGGIISSGEAKTTITGCVNHATITNDNTSNTFIEVVNPSLYGGCIAAFNFRYWFCR